MLKSNEGLKEKRKGEMMYRILLVVIFLVSFYGITSAAEVTFEFEGRYWITDLDASVRVIESGIGTDFDLKQDLGVKDEDYPEARFTWQMNPDSRLRLAYTQVNYAGHEDISRSIEFGGKTYTAGTRVNSEFDIQYLRAGWIWQFVNLMDKIKVGPVVELKGIMADISLDAPNLVPAVSESEDFIAGLPTVGVALDINPVKKVNLFAEISGLSAGSYGYFFDAEAGVKIIPIKNLSITGGFRIIDIEAEYDDDFVKIETTGPFVGATLRF